MGYYTALGPCFVCHRPFHFNPHRVPSYEGKPVCEECMVVVNARRRELGEPEWPILPGAYEPADEREEPL